MSTDNLLADYYAYLADLMRSEAAYNAYNCPVCDREIVTPAPEPDSDAEWDSLTQCPHCETLHYRMVTAFAVETRRYDGEALHG